MRCFIDIEPPQNVKDQLAQVQEELRKEFKGKFERPENMHITLKFLGEIEQVEDIIKKLQTIRFKPFTIRLTHVGHFRHRCLWMGVEGVEHLKEAVDNVLPQFKDDHIAFNPHITLLRMGYTTRIEEKLQKCGVDVLNTSFECASFNLKQSTLTPQGAIHNIVKTFHAH